MELTTEQINIVKHTVGLDNQPKQRKDFYRNRFVAGDTHDELPILLSLIELGLMKCSGPISMFQNDRIYYLTEAGLELAKTYSK